MKEYTLDFTKKAEVHIKKLKKLGDKAIVKKLEELFHELRKHPRTGTGKPKFLKYEKCWSRRIDNNHRLCYEIYDDKVIVLILTAQGHYIE